MPSLGLQIFAAGIRLQPTYPGVTDTGNAHVSGTIGAETGMLPYLTYPVAAPVFQGKGQNILIGAPATYNWGPQVDDIRYCIFIGDSSIIKTNPNGGNTTDGVNVGSDQYIQDPGHTCIGGFAEMGSSFDYPVAGNYNVGVGWGTKVWQQRGAIGGSTVVGALSQVGFSRAGQTPGLCSEVFGFQCRSRVVGVGAGGANILIGYKLDSQFSNCITILHAEAGYTETQDNHIKIGDATHSKVEIGGMDFSNGIVSRTRSVNDVDTTATTSDGTISYSAITAARTVTLPAANAVPAGWRLLVNDDSGSASAVNTITLARVGADTINGAASSVIITPYGCRELKSDGVSKWTVIRSL